MDYVSSKNPYELEINGLIRLVIHFNNFDQNNSSIQFLKKVFDFSCLFQFFLLDILTG